MKMKKIYTETSVGEIIDKITILEIKKKKISKKSNLSQINKEYLVLTNSIKKNVKISKKFKKLWIDLKKTNLKIWEMENHKRLAQKELEKLTRIARDVYKYNDMRAEIKLKINKITGSNLREIKQYTKY